MDHVIFCFLVHSLLVSKLSKVKECLFHRLPALFHVGCYLDNFIELSGECKQNRDEMIVVSRALAFEICAFSSCEGIVSLTLKFPLHKLCERL